MHNPPPVDWKNYTHPPPVDWKTCRGRGNWKAEKSGLQKKLAPFCSAPLFCTRPPNFFHVVLHILLQIMCSAHFSKNGCCAFLCTFVVQKSTSSSTFLNSVFTVCLHKKISRPGEGSGQQPAPRGVQNKRPCSGPPLVFLSGSKNTKSIFRHSVRK